MDDKGLERMKMAEIGKKMGSSWLFDEHCPRQ